MGFFNNFPYTNFHEMNIDWLISELKKLENYVKEYTAHNKVTYAGIWDIRKQYPQWAIVTAGNSTYMSNKPVTSGIEITNKEYWMKLSDLDPRIDEIIAEMENNKKELLEIRPYNAVLYGIDNTGKTDVADALEDLSSKGSVYLPSGIYKISRPVFLKNSLYGCDSASSNETGSGTFNQMTTIMADFTSGFMLNIGTCENTVNIKHIILDTNHKYEIGGISYRNTKFNIIEIDDVSVYGIANNIAIDISPQILTSKCARITNVKIFGEGEYKSVGIHLNHNAVDGLISDSFIMACQIGIFAECNILYADNLHIWCGMYTRATQEWWDITNCIKLTDCRFYGSNIYLDSALVSVYCTDEYSAFNVSNLMVWFDETSHPYGREASLFYGGNRQNYNVQGGEIYCGKTLKNIIGDNSRFDNVKIRTNDIFDEAHQYNFPTYPNFAQNTYELAGLSGGLNRYVEVAKMRYLYGGCGKICFADGEGNCVEIGTYRGSSGDEIRKIRRHGNIDMWYKIENNMLTIYAKEPTDNFTVTYLYNDLQHGGIIYPLAQTLDGQPYQGRAVQIGNDGLTQLIDQESDIVTLHKTE